MGKRDLKNYFFYNYNYKKCVTIKSLFRNYVVIVILGINFFPKVEDNDFL